MSDYRIFIGSEVVNPVVIERSAEAAAETVRKALRAGWFYVRVEVVLC